MKVTLTKPFRYWRHGYAPEDYPAGEAEMDEEAALRGAVRMHRPIRQKARTAQR